MSEAKESSDAAFHQTYSLEVNGSNAEPNPFKCTVGTSHDDGDSGCHFCDGDSGFRGVYPTFEITEVGRVR